jgi:choline monooxygenase
LIYNFYFEDISEDNASKRAKVIADNLEVIREDFEVCGAIQKNYESGGYRSGPLSPRHEAGVAYFQQKLLEAGGK